MAITVESAPDSRIIVGKPKWRPLESEGNLAMLLLLPTIALLLMFIAYPFMRGILLAVTNSKVGVLGEFVGFENFARLLKDPIFHAVVYNTFLYVRHHGVQTHPGLWSPCCSIAISVQGFYARLHPAAVHCTTVLACFAWKWMFDPTFSVLNWMLFKLGIVAASAGVNWLGDGDMAMLSIMIVNI
jgi:multiple sugar transport system permease protein